MSPETEHLIRVSIAADVYRMGEAIFWRRRAEDFEWAKPRLGEDHGERTPRELSIAWNRCDQMARACRNKAHLIETGGATWDEPSPAVPTALAS